MSVLRALLLASLAVLAAPGALAQTGQQLYTMWCQGCHSFPGNNHNNVLKGKDWLAIRIAINTKLAVLGFGLFHGLGLATKVRDLGLSENGLLANLISFNVGVEVGQVVVLAVVVTLFNVWRTTRSFAPGAFYANLALMAGGFALIGYQLTGYFAS